MMAFMRRAPVFVSALFAVAAVAAVGRASPDASDDGASSPAARAADTGSASRSYGWPWRGRLYRGTKLEPSEHLRFDEGDVDDGNFWGTEELVALVERAVARVDELMPSPRLTVGELSERHGGNIVGHSSHENGRDVDLGFYFRGLDEQPVEPSGFVNIGFSGRGKLDDDRVVEFDLRRNWLLVESLIRDRETHVQHVFVWNGIRRQLLEEAKRQSVSQAMLYKAERIIMAPHSRHPHRNHFHVRIFCSADDVPRCKDKGPYWDWLPENHPFHGLDPWRRPSR